MSLNYLKCYDSNVLTLAELLDWLWGYDPTCYDTSRELWERVNEKIQLHELQNYHKIDIWPR